MANNRNVNSIFKIIIISIILYFGYFIFITIKYQHHNNYLNYKKYLWVFNDSIRNKVDSVFFIGFERESDDVYEYIIEDQDGKKYITICQLKNADTYDIDDIMFHENVFLTNLRVYMAEKINLKSDVRPEITIKSNISFNDQPKVNLNYNSNIIKEVHSKKYKGFFGNINKMSISDSNGKHLFIFDYGDRKQQTLFLFFNIHQKLFFILINAERPMSESIIKILNSNI